MLSGVMDPKLSAKERKKKVTRLFTKLQISPKFRREMKIQLKRMYLKTGEVWDDAVLKKNLDEDDRGLVIAVTSFTARILAIIEQLDKSKTENRVTKRRFSLYIHKNREKLLIEERFILVKSGEKHISGIVIYKKFGGEGKSGGFRYIRKMSKRGYEFLDGGTYFMSRIGSKERKLYFRGKKVKLIIRMNYSTHKFCRFAITGSVGIPWLKTNTD